ncbi:MAG TPA: diaminopimelate epimerase [Candidatus Baltobacteraceae bacterium]|nr:diaminopimelate epimerase [Candidatus Baltobacteraceae bacterium]
MSPLAVTKMHGTLNDFIVVDLRHQPALADATGFARKWCDRRAGMGADGVLLIETSTSCSARMRVINADGSEAEMCGNGIRCVVRFMHERGEGDAFTIETLAGPIATSIVSNDPLLVREEMGTPQMPGHAIDLEDADFVSLGNPHAVAFTQDIRAFDLLAAGLRLRDMNVHAVKVQNESTLIVLHHERGVGFTQACGTGAVASAAAAIARGLVKSPVTVRVPGGDLLVEWDGTGHAFLTGPAERVFDATVDP